MKTLLLGSSGQLGRALNQLIPDALCEDQNTIDLADTNSIQKKLEALAPQTQFLINAAAFTDTNMCEVEKEKAYQVNALALKEIAIFCQKRNIHLIHFSTDYVFDGEKSSPYEETDLCAPLSVYGRSKLMAECFIQDLCEKYTILRVSSLCGVGGKNFVETILNKIKNENRLNIVADQFMSPTYTKDLAQLVSDIITKKVELDFGLYHYANQGSCSWAEFAQFFLEIAGEDPKKVYPISYKDFKSQIKRPTYSVLDTKKIQQYTQIPSWKKSFSDYIEQRQIQRKIHL